MSQDGIIDALVCSWQVLPQQTGLVFGTDSDSDSESAPFLQVRFSLLLSPQYAAGLV